MEFLIFLVPSLNVPDTILFQNGQPKIWYFVKDKCLKRKSLSKLNHDNILKSFLRKIPKCKIVAVYIKQFHIENHKEKIIHEYFNREKLSFK